MYFPCPSNSSFCICSSFPVSERDMIYSARALRQFYMDNTDTVVILRPLPGLAQSLKPKSHLTHTTTWEVKILRAFTNKNYST